MAPLNPTEAQQRRQDLKEFILIYSEKEAKYRKARLILEEELLVLDNELLIDKLKNSENNKQGENKNE